MQYAYAIRQQVVLSTRLAAERGFNIRGRPHPIDIDEGLVALADAEEQRGLAYHRIQLVGNPTTIAAAHALQTEVWRIEHYARGLADDQEEWQATQDELKERNQDFYSAARMDIGIKEPLHIHTASSRFPTSE